MNKIIICSCKWYIKTTQNLPTITLMNRIAASEGTQVNKLRHFEKLYQKVTKQKLDVKYFDKCIEMKLIPDFLKFKPPDLDVYKNQDYYAKIVSDQRKLIINELKSSKRELKSIFQTLRTKISLLKFIALINNLLNKSIFNYKKSIMKRHNKKLYNLWMKNNKNIPNTIVNISSKTLTLTENNALKYGLKHSILPKSIDKVKLRANIDTQIRKISASNKINLTFNDKIDLRDTTERFINDAQNKCESRQNQLVHKTLSNLSKNSLIKVCKMDKGNGVVVLNKTDYFNKLDKIVLDKNRFEEINYNLNSHSTKNCKLAPWIIQENKVIYYCRNYIKHLVDQKTYYKIYPRGSQPGKLYGVVKTHKDNYPMRPVLSAVNTPEYNLAKWLEKQIKGCLHDTFSVSSSTEFANKISKVKIKDPNIFASLDIKSLYTQVPLKEVTEDILTTIYDTNSNSIFKGTKITKNILRKILHLCSQSIFLYKEKVYKQIDGVAMGSPLAPILANWFITSKENSQLKSDNKIKPLFYVRYVDDIFVLMKNNNDLNNFYHEMNTLHPNLQFTLERSNNNKLPFLDTEVKQLSNRLQTSVYRKPTDTNLIMQYTSICPKTWKLGLIDFYLNRALNISSNFVVFKEELTKITNLLLKNQYPIKLIQTKINKFLEAYNIDNLTFKQNQITNSKTKKNSENENFSYFTTMYVGNCSLKFHKRITSIFEKHNVVIKPAYTSKKVSDYFNNKSKCSEAFDANVIYKYTCSVEPNISYIGETSRQMFRRIADHKGIDKNSAIFDHLFNCEHCQNSDITSNFKVLKRCKKSDLYSLESMLIEEHHPKLNTQVASKGKAITLSIY